MRESLYRSGRWKGRAQPNQPIAVVGDGLKHSSRSNAGGGRGGGRRGGAEEKAYHNCVTSTLVKNKER